jgi:beta-glucosidase
VLLGAADPGGRLPTTFAARVEDHPSHLTYPGEAGRVSYAEGIFVGYRAFERLRREPLFPFGHGLSYTTFELGPPTASKQELRSGEGLTVRVPVRNTGEREGTTVVQVYVRDVASTLLRPEKELKGFAKVRLAPGESREVAVDLDARAFEAWDPRVHGWVAEPGEFEVLVGTSSVAISGRVTVTLV